jgi:hypothetical protein
MRNLRSFGAASLLVALAAAPTVSAQAGPDSGTRIAAQREALAPLAYMNGVWRGTATTTLPSGDKHIITQTERIGPFLDGSVKVIEGRGYDAEGKVTFNALGIISFDLDSRALSMRSYALGYAGDFAVRRTDDGFVWEIPAGPMTIRYTATVKDGKWREVGDRIVPGKDPARFFEMNLLRIGDSDWPGVGAIKPK